MRNWITVGHIKRWHADNSTSCSRKLPELIQRLVFATTTDLSHIQRCSFPSGDSVTSGGWDGCLETNLASPFFPSGISGWEMGVEPAKGKADKDYEKRKEDSLDLNPPDTTFVFVTPHPWPRGKEKWIKERNEEKHWKEVRVITSVDLELWLKEAPAVAMWLASEITGISLEGLRGIENFWEYWSTATSPVMTTDIVVGGRTTDLQKIQTWLSGTASVQAVQADVPDEATAFLYAAIQGLPEKEKTKALSRCIVVETPNDMRQCLDVYKFPLIFVVPSSCIELAFSATKKGHHVYVLTDSQEIGGRDSLRLSRPHLGEVEKALSEAGMASTSARQTARDFGISIPVLRRQLYGSSLAKNPKWASKDSASVLIPAYFLGAWDEGKKGDREVVEMLSGQSYEKFENFLENFLEIDDPPIQKIGSIWMLKSPLDAWFLLARHVNAKYLQAFQKTILKVLKTVDPKYDLTADKRWAAAIYGKASSNSEWIRKGLSRALIFFAIYGDQLPTGVGGQAFVDKIVVEILGSSKRWELWSSLKDVTTLLAEAAPDAFLDYVKKVLSNSPSVFVSLMEDTGSAFFDECKHSGLLWALESTAWSSDYLGKTASALLHLSKIDTGKQWGNRPINSLREVFLPGVPQTYANPVERLAIFESLVEKDAKATWDFSKDYLGGNSYTISESHHFSWRNDGGKRSGLQPEQNPDHSQYVNGLIPKLKHLASKKENIISSLEDLTHFPDELKKVVLTTLLRTPLNSFSKEEKKTLYHNVQNTLSWINTYGLENQKVFLDELNQVHKKFTPKDPIERLGWLFEDTWPNLPDKDPPFEEKKRILEDMRIKASREILNLGDLKLVIDFAKKIQFPSNLGYFLAKCVEKKTEDEKILDSFFGDKEPLIGLTSGYAKGRVEVVGGQWVEEQYRRLHKVLATKKLVLIFFGLTEGKDTWDKVEKKGIEIEKEYWKLANGYTGTKDKEDYVYAIQKLLDAKRPRSALEIAGNPDLALPTPLLKRLLTALLEMETSKGKLFVGTMDEYHIGHIFRMIYANEDLSIEELVKLELPYASLFKYLRQYAPNALATHIKLQKDPQFFVELVTYLYKPDKAKTGKTQTTEEELKKRRYRLSKDILDSWYLIPGMEKDGSLDGKELKKWIDTVRKECKRLNHVIGGDLQIAELLSRSPSGQDGIWPAVPIRDLIESLDNDIIDKHIAVGIRNSRGVVSRSLEEGGKQERALGEKYNAMSDNLKLKWPRTAAILRSLAGSYKSEAEYEDISSELDQLR